MSRYPPDCGERRLNEFFVDGKGINRRVLQEEIRNYLGPEASATPHAYNGVEGYLVTAVRPFSPDMLDELLELSDAYEKLARYHQKRRLEALSYEEFKASRREEAAFAQSGTGYASSQRGYQGRDHPSSQKSRDPRVSQSRENAYGSRDSYSSVYTAGYGYPQYPSPSWDAYKGQFPDPILCSSCQEQARKGASITLCSECHSRIASILESCEKSSSSSSYKYAVSMITSLLVGVVAGGVIGAEYIARNVVNSLRR